MVGYVAFGEPTIPVGSLFIQALGGRCSRHVTGGELFLGQLHNYCLIRAIGAFEPEAMAPTVTTFIYIISCTLCQSCNHQPWNAVVLNLPVLGLQACTVSIP